MIFFHSFLKKRLMIAVVSFGFVLASKANAAVNNSYNISLGSNRTNSFTIAAWTYDNGTTMEIHARTFDGTTWAAESSISDTNYSSNNPVLAVNSNGDGVVVWAYNDTSRDHMALASSVYDSATSTWSAATRISGDADAVIPLENGSKVPSYTVKLSDTGELVATYECWNGTDRVVSAASGSLSLGWDTVTQLSPSQ